MIHGIGTIVNMAAVLAGTGAGFILKNGLPKRFQDIIMEAAGLSTMFIGISGALSGLLTVAEDGSIGTRYTMIMIFSMILGGLLGELLNIEKQLERMGEFFKKMLTKGESGSGNFTEGFVSATLIYCVGAMAIVGSLNDGLLGDPSVLFAKSILDGTLSIVLTATLGPSVALSALSVGIYQGAITVLSGLIKPYLSDTLVLQMSFVGSVLIFAIGWNFISEKKVKTGNLMPAMFMPVLFQLLPFMK